MEDEQIWRKQLLCFCPSEEIIRKIAAGRDGISNVARRAAAQILCNDLEEWGFAEPIKSLIDETRSELSPYGQEMSWLPEGTMPMNDIVDFFHEGTFDASKEQHLFEAAGNIAEEDLQRAVTLPYEIGIARLGERKIAWSGYTENGNNYAYSKKRNPILHWIDLTSDTFLHTHPRNTESRGDTPSWDDLRAADAHNRLLIAHAEGILEFHGASFEKANAWMQREGILKNGEWKLSGSGLTTELRRCCIEEGIIQNEGVWGEEACGELMRLLNGI